MIFRLEWGVVPYNGIAKRESIVTTNMSNIYTKIDEIRKESTEKDSSIKKHVTRFEIFDDITGEMVAERPFFVHDNDGGIDAALVRWLADYAKKDKRTETINWVTNAISKYDNSNPTIKSLIYSLWEKPERGKV